MYEGVSTSQPEEYKGETRPFYTQFTDGFLRVFYQSFGKKYECKKIPQSGDSCEDDTMLTYFTLLGELGKIKSYLDAVPAKKQELVLVPERELLASFGRLEKLLEIDAASKIASA